MPLHEVDPARVITVVAQPNPNVFRVRPSDPKALQAVMGRFTAARYDRAHHAYDMPAHLADTFAAFCSHHGITLVRVAPDPGTRRSSANETTTTVLREQQQRRYSDEQQEVNRRGMALVRVAEAIAAKARARRQP